MTDLLWILVGSCCPNHVEDSSGRGQNVADADHDQRENACPNVAVGHIDFFYNEDN
jgi:hypothetical protein